MILERVSSDGARPPSWTESGPAGGWNLGPFGVCNYDGPETIRARKYATGTHVLLQEIGVETGVTPREVVWSRDKTRLYRYRRPDGGAGKGRPVPVLLVYGFVLKPYVLDLVPGNSLVEYLVGEGFDVYMLDFGVSGAEDAGLSLEDFVLGYMHGAVEKVLETSGAEEVSLFGQSQGGRCAPCTPRCSRGDPSRTSCCSRRPRSSYRGTPVSSGSGRSRAGAAGCSSILRWCRGFSGTCRRTLRARSSTRRPRCRPPRWARPPGPAASASTTRPCARSGPRPGGTSPCVRGWR
ncbi:MAG: hypothetical protein H0U91_10275 [Rubrobacter sp.]|nr:hypothetical protein [Rubrobacter sp.]MBA3951290.1 hypothetical protein [Rubrobacter sp.]